MPDMEPITREETLMNGDYIEPITREEMILAGEDIEPITRREWFLKKYRGGGDVEVVTLHANENTTYVAPEGQAYSPVEVDVPVPTLTALEVDENGTYTAPSGTAYNEVEVDVPLPENAYLLKDIPNTPTAIATFSDGSDLPMPKLEVGIEPVQDLHGYDAPWVGGAGKNKLDVTVTSVTIRGVTFTVNDDGTIKANGTASGGNATIVVKTNPNLIKGTSYILNGCPQGGGSSTYRLSYSNNVDSSYADNGSGVTFTEWEGDYSSRQVYLSIMDGATVNNLTFKPMIRLASVSDDTFAPYSNICPISGWDEVNVSVSGVNVWDEAWEVGYIDGETGQPTAEPTSIRSENFNKCVPNTNYYGKFNGTVGQALYLYWYDSDKNFVARTSVNNTVSTSPSKASYFKIACYHYGATYNHDISINYPSTDTSYHAYNGTTYTLDLDGTRYGGKVDLVSGVMTVDRVKTSMPANWTVNTESSTYWLITTTRSDAISVENTDTSIRVISDGFKNISANEMITKMTTADNINSIALISSKRLFLKVTKADYPTLDDLYSMIQTNNLRLVYELATPLTIQLTPTVVKSLRGMNNVYADSGDVLDGEYFSKEE